MRCRKKHHSLRLGLFIASCVIIYLFSYLNIYAANHYIRDDASGSNNGTDWTNAWTAQPSTWVRGDTYYYADGEIDEYIIMNVADSGTDRIILKKATSGDHGTETGWDAGYGDGLFHFTATTRIMLLWSSYVTIDGQTGGGYGSWKTGYGFKFSIPDSTNGDNFALIDFGRSTAVTNVIIKHTEFKQAGYDNWEPVAEGYNNHQSCLGLLRVENTTISYCYLHEANQTHLLMDAANNMTIEHNYFEHRSGAPHGESISCSASSVNSGNIFRYNIFEDCAGTGIIVLMTGIQGQMYIYCNIFFTDDNEKWYQTNGWVTNIGASTVYNIEVYNNTFSGLTPNLWAGIGFRNATGTIIKNNLIHSSGEGNLVGTLDNNASEYVGEGVDDCEYDLDANAANVFTSVTPGSKNFKPLAGFAGQDVASDMSDIFTLDIRKEPYGLDGGWDIGAIEGTAGSPPVVGPDWFVDDRDGNDLDGGGDAENAFLTIAAALAVWSTGEIIYLRGDGEWRETVTVNLSGAEGDTNIITRYGEGEKPIINGADMMAGGWVEDGNIIILEGVSIEPKILFWGNPRVLGTNTTYVGLDTDGEWHWSGDSLYVYVDAVADSNYIEAGQRDNGIANGLFDYIVYDNLTIKHANAAGLRSLNGGDNITIKNCLITYNNTHGIEHAIDNGLIDSNILSYNGSNGSDNFGGDNSTYPDNTINNNGLYGWYATSAANNNTISGNDIIDNGSHGGYMLTGCTGNVWKYNLFDGNGGAAIYASGTCDGNSFYYNEMINGGAEGIMIVGDSDDNLVYSNTSRNNVNAALHIFDSTCEGTIFRDNISLSPGSTHIYTGSGVTYTGTHNVFWPVTADDFWDGSSYYATLAAWQAATGQEANSLDSDPLVTDAAGGDFTLDTDSPAIAAGFNWGAIRDFAGLTVPMPPGTIPDIGAHEEQTIGGAYYIPLLRAGSPKRILNAGRVGRLL